MDSDLSGAFGYRNRVEKGAPAKVGETRDWGGTKYTKQADGNWKPQHAPGKEPSAADLKAGHGKVHYYGEGALIQQHDGTLRPFSAFSVNPPRGKKADVSGMTHYVSDVVDFAVGGHPELDMVMDEHDVGIHFDPKNPNKRPIVTNIHGEDITHHVPEQVMQRLTPKHLQAEHDEEERRIDERDRARERAGEEDDYDDNGGDDDGDDGGDDDGEKSLASALTFFRFVEKGKPARAGETRNWGGTEYTKQPDGSWKPKGGASHRVTWWQGPGGTTVSREFASEADAKAHAAKLTAYPKHVKVEPVEGIAMGPHITSGPTPRGKPANTDGWDSKMQNTLDFNWGKGDANEHDVDVHYIAHPGERGGRHEDPQPPYAEVMVVNRHGEDVTHHVPEKHIKDIEARALRHAGEQEQAGREPIDSRI